MGHRIQARRGNGRFTRNTFENTMGLHVVICPNPECRRLNPWPVAEDDPDNLGFVRAATPPTHCHQCGAELQPKQAETPAGGQPEEENAMSTSVPIPNRLPSGTRVRLIDTRQTGQLAPYSPGDGPCYTVVLDDQDATGSRLVPMIRRSQFEPLRPEPNELTEAIVAIAQSQAPGRRPSVDVSGYYMDGQTRSEYEEHSREAEC